MKKHALGLLLPLLLLTSCGGGTSGTSVNSNDVIGESSPEVSEADTSIDDGFVPKQVQIGGNIAAFPTRVWNPEAALPEMCFVTNKSDRNVYDITVDLKEGDVILFFFNYSWDTTIDYKGVDWNYYPEITDVGSYVSDQYEGEDISKKHTEIHILKDGRFTFSYHSFGTMLKGMKTGMVLTALE